VSSGRHAIYIVFLSVFRGNYCIITGILSILMGGIHVSGYDEQKGVKLYGKSNYYLIYSENLVRGFGTTSIVSLVGILVVVIDVNPSHWILDPTVDRSR
jgi:hypothetical protein